MKRNKKLGTQKREREILNCCNKLKRDYDFINHFQLEVEEFFTDTEEYKIQEKQNRQALIELSEKLIKIDDTINY